MFDAALNLLVQTQALCTTSADEPQDSVDRQREMARARFWEPFMFSCLVSSHSELYFQNSQGEKVMN